MKQRVIIKYLRTILVRSGKKLFKDIATINFSSKLYWVYKVIFICYYLLLFPRQIILEMIITKLKISSKLIKIISSAQNNVIILIILRRWFALIRNNCSCDNFYIFLCLRLILFDVHVTSIIILDDINFTNVFYISAYIIFNKVNKTDI